MYDKPDVNINAFKMLIIYLYVAKATQVSGTAVKYFSKFSNIRMIYLIFLRDVHVKFVIHACTCVITVLALRRHMCCKLHSPWLSTFARCRWGSTSYHLHAWYWSLVQQWKHIDVWFFFCSNMIWNLLNWCFFMILKSFSFRLLRIKDYSLTLHGVQH